MYLNLESINAYTVTLKIEKVPVITSGVDAS